jgi:hypothetical protein
MDALRNEERGEHIVRNTLAHDEDFNHFPSTAFSQLFRGDATTSGAPAGAGSLFV